MPSFHDSRIFSFLHKRQAAKPQAVEAPAKPAPMLPQSDRLAARRKIREEALRSFSVSPK